MKRNISKTDLFSIALGSVIGWGAFMLPGNLFLPNYGILNTLIGFAIAVFMLFFIEKNYVRLIGFIPENGGEYSFAYKIFGEKIGFVTGWGLLLAYVSIIPLNATAVPMVLDTLFPVYQKGILLYTLVDYNVYLNDILISTIMIVIFTFINIKSLSSAIWAQKICVLMLLMSLLFIFFLAGYNISNNHILNMKTNLGDIDISSIIRIIAFAPWAFIGFDTIAQMSGEHSLTSKQVSQTTLLSILFGALIYNMLNIMTALGIPNGLLQDSSWATGFAVKNLLGDGALLFLAVAMMGAVISGLNGFFVGSTRLLEKMYSDFTKKQVDEPKTPTNIILFISLCVIFVPFMGRNALLWFVDLSSVGASLAYLVTCLSALKIANSQKDKIIAMMGVCVSIFFLVVLLLPIFGANITTPSYYCLILWVILGVFVYNKFNKNKGNL